MTTEHEEKSPDFRHTNKNRGTHGDSSFMLGGLPSSSENPSGFSRGECQEVLKRLTDAKRRGIERKKAELAAELKNQDELWNAYYDGVYDAIKEIEQAELWAENE